MAEKKYLFVFEVDNKEDLKDNLPDCNGCVCWPCYEHCIGRKKAISRQEAIKRMANAISDAAKRSCNKEFVAEAALNALLEEQNDKENN